MADAASQIVPAAAALAGVALTLAGSALLERHRWRRGRRGEQESRSLEAFAVLLQTITDIGRTLRQGAEQLRGGTLELFELHPLADRVNELVGQARRQGTMARLVGPRSTFKLITKAEEVMAVLYGVVEATSETGDTGKLVNAAKELLAVRDRLLEQVREVHDLPW